MSPRSCTSCTCRRARPQSSCSSVEQAQRRVALRARPASIGFRIEQAQSSLLCVQMYERKIGLAALVTRVERDKTEVPGTAAARFAANEGERQQDFSRGLNPTGV